MKQLSLAICIGLVFVIGGCATTGGTTPIERREAIQSMKNQVLTELYKAKPDVKSQIASAPGYAVFSNANVNLVLASFGGGYGVARNNKTGTDTYMKMGEVGLGLGLGVKDFRAVFVFHTDASLNNFIENGWAFGAQADAAAKASDKGAAVGGEITADNVTIYQLTETGLALQATIKGTKYWKDEILN
ncbi:MAG: YSC84-related protein [Gammaproteobacteria bacterium]|nr:YSC84-related protein [Gammaproteobacteria bacterium]MDH3536648.1 YSC84-related protein [Gammaproteobacteria bacterium]